MRKQVSVLMSAWLVLAVVFAGVFVVAEQGHEHIDSAGSRVPAGADCKICLEIQIALRLLEALGRLGVSFVLAGFIAAAIAVIKPQVIFSAIHPLALSVRLNC